MRFSWVHPEVAERVRASLREGRSSWEDVFEADDVRAGAPPAGVEVGAEVWPRLAAHVARAERVREVIAQQGRSEAHSRFAASPHAVERVAVRLDGLAQDLDGDLAVAGVDEIAGILACEIDEWMAYGELLSRLVQLGTANPRSTVAAFEGFVEAASAVSSDQPSWPERLRVARDGLAALYLRVGRVDDAEHIYLERFREEPRDMTVAIGPARAFLEAGDLSHAIEWLVRGVERADAVGRGELAARLMEKISALRARLN